MNAIFRPKTGIGGVFSGQFRHSCPTTPNFVGFSHSLALKVTSRIAPLLAPILAPFLRVRAKPQGAPSLADERWQGYRVNPASAAAQLFSLQREVRSRVGRIRQPLPVIQGRLDQTVDPAVPEMLRQGICSAVKKVHWLTQSGHCVILDREWEQAAEMTSRFVKRVLTGINQTREPE